VPLLVKALRGSNTPLKLEFYPFLLLIEDCFESEFPELLPKNSYLMKFYSGEMNGNLAFNYDIFDSSYCYGGSYLSYV